MTAQAQIDAIAMAAAGMSLARTEAPSSVSRVGDADPMVGDHAHGAAHHQAPGRTEKAADRPGDEAYGAARARETQSEQPVSAAETAGHDDAPREQVVRRGLGRRAAPYSHERAHRKVAVTATVVGSGPAMAKGRESRSATMAAVTAVPDEGGGDAVSKPSVQRRSEDQRRKGEPIPMTLGRTRPAKTSLALLYRLTGYSRLPPAVCARTLLGLMLLGGLLRSPWYLEPSFLSRSMAASAMACPWLSRPPRRARSTLCGITPPTATMIAAALLLERLAQAGTRVKWPAASDDTPTIVHVVLDRLAGGFLWRLEKGPISTSKPRSAKVERR